MTAAMENDNDFKKFSTDTADFWLDANGIIRRVIHVGADENLDEAKKGLKFMLDISGGMKRPLLVDLRGMKSITREARQFLSGESSKHFTAVATIVDSPITKMIGNFAMRINPLGITVRIFSDESKALEWLMGQKK